MGGSAKAVKARKQGQKKQTPKDFAKQKQKVGKAKKPAQNATNTNFSSKRISMPSQRGIEDKGEMVSYGKNLNDLLSHVFVQDRK